MTQPLPLAWSHGHDAPASRVQRLAAIRDQLKLLADYL